MNTTNKYIYGRIQAPIATTEEWNAWFAMGNKLFKGERIFVLYESDIEERIALYDSISSLKETSIISKFNKETFISPGYEENTIIAPNSSATGVNSSAGCKYYKIISFDSENKTYTLNENVSDKYEVGDYIVILDKISYELEETGAAANVDYIQGACIIREDRNSVKYNMRYDVPIQITEISDNTITVNNFVKLQSSDYDEQGQHIPENTSYCLLTCYRKPQYGTEVDGLFSIVCGDSNITGAAYGSALGKNNRIYGNAGAAFGHSNLSGFYAHTEGTDNLNIGRSGHVEGRRNENYSYNGHVEGEFNANVGRNSHVEGYKNIVGNPDYAYDPIFVHKVNIAAHAEGIETKAFNKGSHTEGFRTMTGLTYNIFQSTPEKRTNGIRIKVSDIDNLITGQDIYVFYINDIENYQKCNVVAKGDTNIIVEDIGLITAENYTQLGFINPLSLFSGIKTIPMGDYAHVQGKENIALAPNVFVSGTNNIAMTENSTVLGAYATIDVNKNYIFQLGCGAPDARADAIKVTTGGKVIIDDLCGENASFTNIDNKFAAWEQKGEYGVITEIDANGTRIYFGTSDNSTYTQDWAGNYSPTGWMLCDPSGNLSALPEMSISTSSPRIQIKNTDTESFRFSSYMIGWRVYRLDKPQIHSESYAFSPHIKGVQVMSEAPTNFVEGVLTMVVDSVSKKMTKIYLGSDIIWNI